MTQMMTKAGVGMAVLAAGWLLGLDLAAAATTFPASLEREPLLLWLQRETDILPNQVVAVTPQALTAVMSSVSAGDDQAPRLVIRSEALTSEVVARAGAMSWQMTLSADCQGRRVKLGETIGYPQRNLLGGRRSLRPADADWRAPGPGTALEHAWRAACEPGFGGPFRAPAVTLAEVDGAAAPPAASVAAPLQASAPAPAAIAAAPAPVTPRAPSVMPSRKTGLAAQVGAGASEADARALLRALAAPIADRPTWVETAEVGGRVWRRAMVGGFADASEAARFCVGLRSSGRACFVRVGPVR